MAVHKFYPWRAEYALEINEIDNQHKVLVDFINELYEAVVDKKADAKAKEIIVKMQNYALFHFETEEAYFKKFNYPETLQHISEHRSFVKKTGEFKEIADGNHPVTFRIVQFLKEWIGNHIQQVDKRYVSFLKPKIESKN
jgi:hemerythrin-like metal-binding protein